MDLSWLLVVAPDAFVNHTDRSAAWTRPVRTGQDTCSRCADAAHPVIARELLHEPHASWRRRQEGAQQLENQA